MERGEIEISFVIGNIKEEGGDSAGEGDDRDVVEKLKVLRW